MGALTPCASCPYLPGNHKEFGEIAEKLCLKHGKPMPDFWGKLRIRQNVVEDGIQRGQLLCHLGAYDVEMNARPDATRACAGLALTLQGKLKPGPFPKG